MSVIAFVTDGVIHDFLIRRHGEALVAGPKTAAWAGVVGWVAFSVTGPVQFIPLGFFNCALWWSAGASQLPTSIVATIAGAAVDTEKT